MVSKYRERLYRAGRCPHWIKVKNPNGPRAVAIESPTPERQSDQGTDK